MPQLSQLWLVPSELSSVESCSMVLYFLPVLLLSIAGILLSVGAACVLHSAGAACVLHSVGVAAGTPHSVGATCALHSATCVGALHSVGVIARFAGVLHSAGASTLHSAASAGALHFGGVAVRALHFVGVGAGALRSGGAGALHPAWRCSRLRLRLVALCVSFRSRCILSRHSFARARWRFLGLLCLLLRGFTESMACTDESARWEMCIAELNSSCI